MIDDLVLTIINNNGVDVTDSRDVAKMIGKTHSNLMRDIRNLIKRNPECCEYFIESTYKDANNQIRNCYLITKKGREIMLNKYKLQSQAGRLEIKFLDGLEEVLSPFGIKGIRQYPVDINNKHYRIDYYIPSLKVAIEYDENGHAGYAYEQHEGRQKEIEKELGCKFIRVTDKESDLYNIGLVVKGLFA